MNVISDTHIHSTFSCDGHDTIENMTLSAIAKGFKYICFTEHIDYNPHDDGFGYYNYEVYSSEIERVREKYGTQITILKGIEFSEPHLYRTQFEKELNRDYDMIMGSLHFLKDKFYGENGLTDEYSVEQLLEIYFKELLEMVNAGGFDVLAHFDFPRRYYGRQEVQPDFIHVVLKRMIDSGIALEINTSGYRKGYGYPMPDFTIIDEYLKLGGRRVTFGSDSHRATEVGAGFDEVSGLLEDKRMDYGVFMGRKFRSL